MAARLPESAVGRRKTQGGMDSVGGKSARGDGQLKKGRQTTRRERQDWNRRREERQRVGQRRLKRERKRE